jgi:hypothetical protein
MRKACASRELVVLGGFALGAADYEQAQKRAGADPQNSLPYSWVHIVLSSFHLCVSVVTVRFWICAQPGNIPASDV